jgi:hypothetical protein
MTEQPKSWRDVIKVHPAADMFPMMTADKKKVLGEDIKKNRLHERVTLYGNLNAVETWQLLDGRNRLDAMELVGLPVFVENGEIRNELWAFRRDDQVDPYEFVISANVHRRHLTPEQKRDLIAKLLKAQPSKSNRTIAKQTKADHKTVGAMRDKLEARGEIPHVSTVEDTKGRKQPSNKKRRDIEDRVGTDATADEPAQAEGAFPIYGSCAGGRVVTESTSTKAKATDRAATPKTIIELRARLREETGKQRMAAQFNQRLSHDLRITQIERDALRREQAAMAKPMPVFRAAADGADRAAQRRMVSEGIMSALDLFECDGIDPADRAAGIIERFNLAIAEASGPGKFSVMRVRRAIEAMTTVFAAITAEQHEEEQSI